MAQPKAARGSQAERCHDRIFSQFWLIIAVPAIAVLAVSIEIDEYRVKTVAAPLFNLLLNCLNDG